MTTRKKVAPTWAVQPIVAILIMVLGVNYARGKYEQMATDAASQIVQCRLDAKEIKKEQDATNKEVLMLLQQVKIELAEVKTEVKLLSRQK